MTQTSTAQYFTHQTKPAALAWQTRFSTLIVASIAFPMPLFLIGLFLTNVYQPAGFVIVYVSGALGLCMPVFLVIGICLSVWKFLCAEG